MSEVFSNINTEQEAQFNNERDKVLCFANQYQIGFAKPTFWLKLKTFLH